MISIEYRAALKDRAAVVTGASSGIGRAIALALADRGASVCVVGRDTERLQATATDAGAGAFPVAIDLTKQEAPEVLFEAVERRFSQVNVLVHCAGAIVPGCMQESSLQDFETQIRANVMAPYALSQRLLGSLIEGKGDVVFVNSSILRYPRANAGQFASTQHALRGLADCLREELNPLGVRVMSVFVGRTATPRQELLHDLEGRPYKPDLLLQPESVATTVVNALCLPRDAEITELYIRPMVKS